MSENNLKDQMNEARAIKKKMITGSSGVRVISNTSLHQEILCFVENRKERKKMYIKKCLFDAKVMVDCSHIPTDSN